MLWLCFVYDVHLWIWTKTFFLGAPAYSYIYTQYVQNCIYTGCHPHSVIIVLIIVISSTICSAQIPRQHPGSNISTLRTNQIAAETAETTTTKSIRTSAFASRVTRKNPHAHRRFIIALWITIIVTTLAKIRVLNSIRVPRCQNTSCGVALK